MSAEHAVVTVQGWREAGKYLQQSLHDSVSEHVLSDSLLGIKRYASATQQQQQHLDPRLSLLLVKTAAESATYLPSLILKLLSAKGPPDKSLACCRIITTCRALDASAAVMQLVSACPDAAAHRQSVVQQLLRADVRRMVGTTQQQLAALLADSPELLPPRLLAISLLNWAGQLADTAVEETDSAALSELLGGALQVAAALQRSLTDSSAGDFREAFLATSQFTSTCCGFVR